MALIMLEGWDKYGSATSGTPGSVLTSMLGEWTAVGSVNIVAPLSTTGQAVSYSNVNTAMSRTLSANYSRLIGGFRFNMSAFGSASCGLTFTDTTSQCTITINTTGTISLRNGGNSGTALATSAGAVAVSTTHFISFDITFGNAASYQVWLDGVSVISGTGDTTTTANSYANGVAFVSQVGNIAVPIFDDFHLFDATGTTNNAVLLDSPRIETTFPTADSAVQFTVGPGVLGSSAARNVTNNTPVANTLVLRRFMSTTNCTINSISCLSAATSAGVNARGVIYSDSSGVAGTLMSSGTTVTGITNGVVVTLPLTTPQNLTAGTPYWLGFMNDALYTLILFDASASTYRASVTFASGAPGTAPAMTSGQPTFHFWGNLTNGVGNYDEVNQQPPDGQYSYVYETAVGEADLYTFTALSSPPPAVIYAVAVKAYAQKSDSGAQTVSMRMKSGAVDSGGSLTGQALGTTFGWLGSFFPTDPNTSAAWTTANLNAATSGFKIDS